MNKRLLIVDDDAGVCQLLKEWLTESGFICQTALSGGAALEKLKHDEFDAVISDLSMPGVSGFDLLIEVRKTYPHMAFLMATGMGDISLGIQAMKQGADDYLLKPFQLDAVVTSVERALEMRRLERELGNHRKHLEEMVGVRTHQLQVALSHINQIYDETLEALGAALDLKDGDTAGHSRRVTRFCLEIAKKMGCSEDEMQQLKRGAYLHDIGKIAIPDAILLKPAALTSEEMTVMWAHPYIGYELVGRISFLAAAAEIVLTHHERLDGSGYPQRLVGDEIPLGSRIFAVADTVDAMTSDRPYRRALPYFAAQEEIRRYSGRLFDPKVVEAFFSLPDNLWMEVRSAVDAPQPSLRGGRFEMLPPLAKPMESARVKHGPRSTGHAN